MNHGRLNAPVRFCPTCGDQLDASGKSSGANSRTTCDDAKHASRRKDRNAFCCDCGKKLI
jgi:NADH pyrophosphatase NudC (nudix superfamily)